MTLLWHLSRGAPSFTSETFAGHGKRRCIVWLSSLLAGHPAFTSSIVAVKMNLGKGLLPTPFFTGGHDKDEMLLSATLNNAWGIHIHSFTDISVSYPTVFDMHMKYSNSLNLITPTFVISLQT